MVRGFEVRTEIKRNKSFSFILPLIGLKMYNTIINTYIGDLDHTYNGEEDVNLIYVLSNSDNPILEANVNFINKYSKEEGFMYVYKIPKEFNNDYVMFLEGKYSKFSKRCKEILCNHSCRNSIRKPHETKMYSILYRTNKRRKELEEIIGEELPADAEYASILDLNSEIYGG